MKSGGSYDPHAVESEIYESWEAGGYFHAQPNPDKQPYVIDIPLPNVTGALHLGHALNNTLQDILIRHKRMCGYEALWMPGTDHAGIATQAVVERKLKEEQNLTRHELGREGLVKKIWEWKERYGGQILTQLRKMGFSCDWARTRFTLDEVCAKAVYEVFFRWFKEGLIYRGLRLVNWDAHLQTAVADDEIIHETVKGHLWHYRYPILGSVGVPPASVGDLGSVGVPPASVGDLGSVGVPPADSDEATLQPGSGQAPRRSDEGNVAAGLCTLDAAARCQGRTGRSVSPDDAQATLQRATRKDAKLGEDYLVIATTRPETMLGDTAVAVHPDDERYRHLIGKDCILPLMNRPIPIIADDILVDPAFGTGCVKVTPGHDPNDYEFAQRHNVGMINILTSDGRISENGGPYAGLSIQEARRKVVEDLEKLGLMEKMEPYETEIGHSDRSKTPIEPMLSEQWFMKMSALAELAMDVVRDGRVQFFPARYAKTYLDWLGEKRDWCISRQLWWGHRIPVWTKRTTGQAWDVVDMMLLLASPQPGVCVVVESEQGRRLTVAGHQSEGDDLGIADVLKQREATRPDEQLTWYVCPRDPDAVADVEIRVRPGDENWVPPRLDVVDISWARWLEQKGFKQDPDVLDTWFSSALWPFSTLGWPHGEQATRQQGNKAARQEDTDRRASESSPGASLPRCLDASLPSRADFDYFFPTSTLVTARGIITLWVARMVMTSLHFTGRVPFHHVHIHPIIQDGEGRTMSKSLGNGVDPLDIIELYGTDALRFTMAQMDTETQDVRLPVKPVRLPDGREVNSSERFELGRNFCNKLWQATTGFVLANLEGYAPRPLKTEDLALEDRWIISRLAGCIAECDRRLARYQISEVAGTLYTFFWNDFCDWYVELVKPRLFGRSEAGQMVRHTDQSARVAQQVLVGVLDQTLRLLHPIIPFITEALWHRLGEKAPQRGIGDVRAAEEVLITAAWPDAEAYAHDRQAEREMEALQNVIRALRDTLARINTGRAAAKTPAIGKLPRAVIRAEVSLAAGLHEQHAVLERLGRCESLEVGTEVAKPPESATQVLTGVEVYVPLSGLMDLAAERKRLQKERDNLHGHIERLAGKLASEGFISKAPAAVVEQERGRLAEMKERLATLERNLSDLNQ